MMHRFATLLSVGLLAVGHLPPLRGDVIIDWNNEYLHALRQVPKGPPTMARSGAMVMTAMYNAVNAVDLTHEPYGDFHFAVLQETSRESAAAQAAHDVLQSLYPTLSYRWSSRLVDSLSAIPDGPAKAAGLILGQAAADHMITLRAQDGAEAPQDYSFGDHPGDWVMTQPGWPVDPHAGNILPWSMARGDQFRPQRLAAYGSMHDFLISGEYAAALDEVKDLGRVDRWQSTDEAFEIAFFWANDRDGTFKPMGHLNSIAQTFSQREFSSLSVEERLSANARLFALINLALADAGIAAWDCKFLTEIDLWRPITAIRRADEDGNPLTLSDPAWEPLNHVDPDGDGPAAPDPFTPPFPAYISGHTTFASAFAAVMSNYFGGDTIPGGSLTIGTEDPYVPGVTRTFESWQQMALENGRSRIYLGVHWPFDVEDGLTTGSAVGQHVFDHFLTPVPEPSATLVLWSLVFMVTVMCHPLRGPWTRSWPVGNCRRMAK